ncbi:MAG: LacI family transcriptional regulator [Ruminococcus sp.]|nr:LacI family transcriptional regulator [Ruminococcus sp.]
MSVTIKDVAKMAGVSVATVSRMLNGTTTVSTAAAEKIKQSIEDLGYSPNFLGRNLRRSETNIILAIIPAAEQSFYNEVLRGMQNTALKYNYDLLIGISNANYDTEKRLLSMLTNRVVDAAVILGSKLTGDELNSLGDRFPIALCCERVDGASVLTVTVDDENASFAAVQAVINKGHRRIGLVTVKAPVPSALSRKIGYINALERNNILLNEDYIFSGGYDYDNAQTAFSYFASLKEPPTAICCVSDMLAVGVIKAAITSGTEYGSKLSVVGFDNIPLAGLYTPGLATVEQPGFTLGKTVIEGLIKNKNNDRKENNYIKLPYKFIERESLKDF